MQILSALCILFIRVFVSHVSTGDVLQDGQSPLHSLDQAAVHYASAIRLSSREARLHFLLGLVLEEQHYAAEMYGLEEKVEAGETSLCKVASLKILLNTDTAVHIDTVQFLSTKCPLNVAFRDPD